MKLLGQFPHGTKLLVECTVLLSTLSLLFSHMFSGSFFSFSVLNNSPVGFPAPAQTAFLQRLPKLFRIDGGLLIPLPALGCVLLIHHVHNWFTELTTKPQLASSSGEHSFGHRGRTQLLWNRHLEQPLTNPLCRWEKLGEPHSETLAASQRPECGVKIWSYFAFPCWI